MAAAPTSVSPAVSAVDLSNPFNHHVRRVKQLFLPYGLVLSFISKEKVEQAKREGAFFEASQLEVDMAESMHHDSTRVQRIAQSIHELSIFSPKALVGLIAQYALQFSFYSNLRFPVTTLYISPSNGLREAALFHTMPQHVSYGIREGMSEQTRVQLAPSARPVTQFVMQYGESLFVPQIEGVQDLNNAVLVVFRPSWYLAQYGTTYPLCDDKLIPFPKPVLPHPPRAQRPSRTPNWVEQWNENMRKAEAALASTEADLNELRKLVGQRNEGGCTLM